MDKILYEITSIAVKSQWTDTTVESLAQVSEDCCSITAFASAEHFPLSKLLFSPLFPLRRLTDWLAELSTGNAF